MVGQLKQDMEQAALTALPSAHLFRLCATQLDQNEYWAEFVRRYNAILVRAVYFAYQQLAEAEPPPTWFTTETLQDLYTVILKNDGLILAQFCGATEAEAEVYLAQIAIEVTINHLQRAGLYQCRAEAIQLDEV